MVRDSLNRILGSSLTDTSWFQAQLCVPKGGLGLRSAKKHSSAAFLSSVFSSETLVEQLAPNLDFSVVSTLEARELLSVLLDEEEVFSDESVRGLSQKQLSLKIDEKDHEKLLAGAELVRDKARLNSVQLPHAGDWLNVVPSPSLGLQLRPPEFRVSVLYRLGMPIFEADGPCVSCRQPGSDRHGDHAVGCASQCERIVGGPVGPRLHLPQTNY